MQATEIYELGKKAYNGNQQARKQWLEKLSPIAIKVGLIYQVCPSLILGKAVRESGWGSDLYEEKNLEPRFGIKMQRKAQKHNNLMGMNAFDLNCKYLEDLPLPAWNTYKTTFKDYGPHIHNGQYVMTPGEPWKSFINIEDCFEDWAANMRFQAAYHKKEWGTDLRDQLVAIESYTPEGAAAASKGMHFQWQDNIIDLANEFNLWKYDKEVFMSTEAKLTVAILDQHIKKAYEQAHKYCHYGPSGVAYPPASTGQTDCVGLVFRAFYTMGRYPASVTIDQVVDLCKNAGMVYSTDINDAWKHHSVVCMQDKNNIGTMHVNHVFYSLGGTSVSDISKYDLGSNERIAAAQPFTHVAVNQWEEKRILLCVLYLPQETAANPKKAALPKYDTTAWSKGEIKKRTGVYEGPGSQWKRLAILDAGTAVEYGPNVTNTKGNKWRRIRTNKVDGYVYGTSVGGLVPFVAYAAEVKKLAKNDFAALRIGPSQECDKIDELKSGTEVVVRNMVTHSNQKWAYVQVDKKYGFVYSELLTT